MENKPKIFLISNTANFFSSFALKHIEELSKEYNLFVCCKNSFHLKKLIPNNVTLININFKRGISLFHDIATFITTLFFFFKERPNFSVSFTPKIGFIVLIASFITRTPNRLHWFTGQIWASKKGIAKLILKSVDKFIYFLSHKVLIDSISQRNFLIKHKVVSAKKSIVLNKGSVGGVNIKKFKFNNKIRNKLRKKLSINKSTFIFLYLGRINQDKGINLLLKAFKKISKDNDILLIFVGSIEDQVFRSKFKNQKKILYFNYSKNPEDWFSVADILCLPSYREGFGTVIIEAASCKTPALCSNIYGLKDSILEGKTGFFHKVGSIDDIKKKMLYILSNKKLIKKFGISARKRVVKDFNQSLITKKLLKFINSNNI